MTALPTSTGVVRRLYDAVTREVDDQTPPLRTGLVVDHNEAADLLAEVAAGCDGHLVCETCGAHHCDRHGIDGGGPWVCEHWAEPLCPTCAAEFCRRCSSLARREVSGL